ncbi:hypothetical protein FS749_007023 [Ceratobasidium sp. UAMH 11750]|nr:hypothetical protein FS749_007023 [Ceratobasidium sp. UAMH 11750]
MAPSSRMNLASLLQSDPPDEPRRPPPSLPPLPPPPAPYPPESAPYPSQPSHSQPSHSQPHAQPLPPNYTSAPSQSYSGSSSQYYSQPPSQSQHLPPPQPAAHYHQPQSHSYTPSPTHTGPPPPPPAHSHQYHQHSHQHAHHPLHTHLPSHSHSHHPHPHHHPHAHAHHHPHSHHPIAGHAHSHLHVVHAHPPAAPTPPAPASSSSTAGSPPAFASHAFNQPPGARGPQPIIPLNSTPAPRSPVHYTAGASRSPTAPYPIYGAGSLTGRRSPEFAPSGQPPMAGSSSGPRRNTLTSANVSSGPQAIEPVTLRDYPPYPNSGSTKHADEGSYPPAFSAPVYGSRPQSPQTQTGNKARRSGGTSASIASRGTGAKRSVGGSSDLKRPNERSEKDEREMDKEREEHAHRERERERERDREREREQQERSRERREYEERAVRERERERQILEIDFRDGRRPSAIKRPLESEFARRPASTSEWDRPRERGERDHRERRVPREQERDWRREEDEARQSVPALVQSKHLPPLAAHGAYVEKQSHNLPLPQQSRPHTHGHYTHSHPRAASPLLPYSTLPTLLAPIWLGTYVYPNIPFPVRLPPTLPRNNLTPEGYKPYQYSILIPSGLLPTQPPSRSPRPDVLLWGGPHTGYTDDSNVLLAAVHSNKTTWSDIRHARRSKQDVKIVVGVWAGGANGGRTATRPMGGAWEGVPGGGQLHSSSWGNTHDGGGMEIVEVVWIEPGSAHAPHRPNRRERMEQYAKRRADLELVPPAKRDRIETWYLDSDEEDAAIPAKRTWDVGETIVFGKGGASSGFVYEPHTLRSVVFEESNERSTKRLRTKDSSDDRLSRRRDIVLENDDEQYILALKSGNENASRKYTLSTLSPKSKKAEVLRKSLTEEDVSFLDKGLCVWLKDGVESKSADADKDKMDTGSDEGARAEDGADGDRKGWFCHVSRWKFAADDLKDGVQA